MSIFGLFGTAIEYTCGGGEKITAMGNKMKNVKHDITSESAWKKTSQFIKEKYGKKIEFQFLSVTSNNNGDGLESSSSQRSYVQGDDLVVPLKYKNAELGNVVVCRGATLPFEQQQETEDLIRFLIEPQAYNRMLELKLSSSTQPEQESNVIRLFGRTDYVDQEEVIVINDEQEKKRRLVSPFIHVKSKSATVRHKIALKIHEMIGTIVFIRLQDIADGSQPVTHEMDLSDTTLFIEDLTALNPHQMDLLERLARRNLSDSKINCAVIVGSGLNDDQIHHLDCSQAMKNDLLGLAYDADRVPVTQQASQEILDLLFFNDDDMIS